MARQTSSKKTQAQMEADFSIGLFVGVTAWAQLAAQRASDKAPVATGRLARSITSTTAREIDPLVWQALIGTNVIYAAAQEFGSGLHSPDPAKRGFIIIEAKNAKSLAFFWPGGPKNIGAYDPESGLHFFKRVNHPGVRAQPYFRPGIESTRDEGRKLVMGAIKAQLTKA